jgi:nucleoside-diphosphate-sugar epimerase
MHTILGAGGAIGNELAKELGARGHQVRLVARNPRLTAGATEIVSANVANLDQTINAISGSAVVYLVVGLKYDINVWQALWPRIMRNAIQACKRTNAKLIFFDVVYMYGKVSAAMTEETPFNPCSKKGEVRAQIATTLLDEIRTGHLTGLIARSADFYGPDTRTGIPNVLVFDNFAKGAKASWLVNDSVIHSFTFTPDAAKSLVLLSDNEKAWNQTWHVPTKSNPPTGREFIEMAAKEFGVDPRYRVLSRPMVKLAGWFDKTIRETYEMLYQSDNEYLFDSTKFIKAFNFEPTSYGDGIRIAAAAYKQEVG